MKHTFFSVWSLVNFHMTKTSVTSDQWPGIADCIVRKCPTAKLALIK